MARSSASDTQHGAVTHVKLACQSECEKLKGNQKRVVVERRVLSRDTQGLASWSQVLIFREGVASSFCLVSLFGAGAMVVYTASPILRSNYFGIQNM